MGYARCREPSLLTEWRKEYLDKPDHARQAKQFPSFVDLDKEGDDEGENEEDDKDMIDATILEV